MATETKLHIDRGVLVLQFYLLRNLLQTLTDKSHVVFVWRWKQRRILDLEGQILFLANHG